MSKEEIFNASADAYSLLGGFLKDVAQEIGMDKTLALFAGETFGSMLAGMMKEKLGDKDLDTATIAAVLSDATDSIGSTVKIEESTKSVRTEIAKCPIYHGFKEAGLDHKTIESTCNCMADGMLAEMRKSYPQLSWSVKFRSAPDQPCIEEYTIEK